VHWLAKSKLDSPPSQRIIISFSLGDETFGTMQLPVDMDMDMDMQRNIHHLTELGGRLCLFSTELDKANMVQPYRYHVWLLREHGVSAWDLHCRIEVDALPPRMARSMRIGEVITPLSVIDNGRRRIVLVQPRHRLACAASFKLHAYDPATGDVENLLDRSGLISNKLAVLKHAALYEESLYYPGQPHMDIIFAMSLVLRQLSSKTLARLKCVCRSWHAMIQSDIFGRTRHNISPFDYIF
jgi:hypothetical protein